ncbi:sell [Bugula neritina]|uniref:Sell n=1 Tax=Bugula neritina TaxID=10212 RepID=A0A7J7KCP9_BUGNE|nr:sell [Bugula neritina]
MLLSIISLVTASCDINELRSANVVVISFGVIQGARKWLEETSCPFTLLLDPERKLYKYVGLQRSLYKTWGLKECDFLCRTDEPRATTAKTI